MGETIADIFNSFQNYLNNEQELREEIRCIAKEIEKSARDILMILQNIHTDANGDENAIVSQHCARARAQFEDVREKYARLAEVVPAGQYYRFNDQWRFVTQRLCFLASLVVYLEVKMLVSKETVAEIIGVKNNRDEGFHLDLEDFLMGLLHLSSELTRFAVNSVTNGDYNRPIEIARFINDLNAGFRLLNLKNDSLRKRFDGLKYEVKKIEEVVYDLSIRGLKPVISNQDTLGQETLIQEASSQETSSRETSSQKTSSRETLGQKASSQETLDRKTSSQETSSQETLGQETSSQETLGREAK